MSDKFWHLKSAHLFASLGPEDLRLLESRSRIATFPRQTPVYLPADATDDVFLLASGRVKICHLTPDGKQSILAFIEPGELFGELAMLHAGSRDEYAETVEKSSVIQIPAEAITQLMQRQPQLSLGITKMIGLRRQRIERRLKNLLFLSNRERLTHLLLELVEQYGRAVPEGVQLAIKLSHQELANIIGSTRETVTVVLGELQSEQLIRVGRRKITIVDLEVLAGSVDRKRPLLPEPVPVREG